MKTNRITSILFLTSIILLAGCNSKNHGSKSNSNDTQELNENSEKTAVLQTELLGNYHGVQPSYFLKNKSGQDMIINGKKIPVPASDYLFVLNENHKVTLQQINSEDKSVINYKGKYQIISNDDSNVKIECSLSDGQTSNPTYALTINKTDKKGTCVGGFEPEFKIEKQN